MYPVLFLYSQNINEYPERALLVPLLIALVFSAVVFGISKFLFKVTAAAAIFSSATILVCLSFGRFLTFYKDSVIKFGSLTISHELIGFFISVCIIAITAFCVRKYKASLTNANQVFLIFSCILIVFPLFSIISFEAKTGRIFKPTADQALYTTKKEGVSKDSPDIYYIVFDRYAGPKSLKDEYSFDNSKLYNYLEKNGFYIAKEATSNYPKTFLSLASSLNFEYLDFLTEKTNGGGTSDESLVTPYIRNNNVVKFLKDKGYAYVHIGPVWNPTSINPNADKNYIFRDGLFPNADEFTSGFLNQTIAAPVFKALFPDKTAVSKDQYNNDHRKRILYAMRVVKEVPKMPGPKFVFVHVLIPHDPFVLDKNCKPISEEVVSKNSHQVNYANQLTCANTMIMETVDAILKDSSRTPIIILQSDEGPFPMNSPIPSDQSWGSVSTDSLQEKFPILNAYLLPGNKDAKLYPSITPVNSFRVLFNAYFNTNYPLLEDKNYVFKDGKNYYKFTDVTDRLQEAKEE